MLGLKQVRRVFIFVIGMTVLAIGFVMLVTPGPACIVIPAGLAILGTEFLWARRLYQKAIDHAKNMANRNQTKAKAFPVQTGMQADCDSESSEAGEEKDEDEPND